METANILLIGDVSGLPGMDALRKRLPDLLTQEHIDFVIANGENAAHGVGIQPEQAKELFRMGVDCITTGNHVWRHPEIRNYIQEEPRMLRPLNYPKSQPGRGFGKFETAGGIPIAVINLAGRVYMDPADNPFIAADQALASLPGNALVFVDFHGEATSEKRAMGFYLDGRVSAVVGTHTHVQTSDEQILAQGTAYITDLGMTGPHDSVIGMKKELIMQRFVVGLPESFRPAKDGARLQGLVVRVGTDHHKAISVKRIDIPVT